MKENRRKATDDDGDYENRPNYAKRGGKY